MNLIPQRWDRRKEPALPCAKSQVSMRRTGEFMADSCNASQNPMKKEAGVGGEQKHDPISESQTQQKPRKLP